MLEHLENVIILETPFEAGATNYRSSSEYFARSLYVCWSVFGQTFVTNMKNAVTHFYRCVVEIKIKPKSKDWSGPLHEYRVLM